MYTKFSTFMLIVILNYFYGGDVDCERYFFPVNNVLNVLENASGKFNFKHVLHNEFSNSQQIRFSRNFNLSDNGSHCLVIFYVSIYFLKLSIRLQSEKL